MSDVSKDPFDELSWGSLRYSQAVKEFVDRSNKVMEGIVGCFAVES